MNNPRAVKQIYLDPFPFADALANVQTDIGYFSIGFKSQTRDYRRQLRAGKTEHEHINYTIGNSLSAMERGAPEQRNGIVRMLFSCLPQELLITAVREYTSGLRLTHCELAFYLKHNSPLRTEAVNVLAVGVNADTGVFMMPRKFNAEYEWHHVACDEARMISILFFAFEEQGKRFNVSLMSKSVVNPGPDDRSEYFCSHFTMACLERLPHPTFHFNRANAQSIDDIYRMVTSPEVRANNVVTIPQAQFNKTFGQAQDRIVVDTETPEEKDAKRRATRKKV